MKLENMVNLKFNGEITLEEVYSQNKSVIHNSILESISTSYLDSSIDEVLVISISINQIEYSIKLHRSKFKVSLENIISSFEETEEYEKCQLCLNIIRELDQKKESI